MKKRIACFSLFLLLAQCAGAQGKLNKADSLSHAGDMKASIEEHKRVFQIDSLDYLNVYNLACLLSIERQTDSAFKYLYYSARLNSTELPLTDPDFIPLKDDKRWPVFEDYLVSLIQTKYEHPINDEVYARKLWHMRALDQAYYVEIGLAERKIGRNSSVVYALWKMKESINEQNQKELEGLVSKKGWPKISQVGKHAAGAAFLVIQHSDLEKQKKYLPIIKKLCEEKEADWGSYALMYDRIQVDQNKPQRYGSQVIFNNKTNKYELGTLEDESKVEEWRKAIGMQPLADYLMGWDIKWEPKTKQ